MYIYIYTHKYINSKKHLLTNFTVDDLSNQWVYDFLSR